MRKFFVNYWGVFLVGLLSLFIIWPLWKQGYFPHHDNLQVIKIVEIRKCLADFQIPCRWTPDLGFGYGFPLFNYYNPGLYYLGGFLSYIFDYLVTAKLLFFLVLVLAGLTMFILVRQFFDNVSALVASILYLFAPYRALDIYVRGALAESLAIAIIPLVLLFIYRLIKKDSWLNFLGLTLTVFVFLISHNISVLIFAPLLIVWSLFWFYHENGKNLKKFMLALLLGVGMASFFIFPAFFEKSYVHIENLKESIYIPSFRAHFVTIRQFLFSRFWGYGASTWMEEDGISFQVGWPHWWLVVLASLFVVFNLIVKLKKQAEKKSFFVNYKQFACSKEKKDVFVKLAIVLIFFFLFSLFMGHNRSAAIWEKIETLQFIQFPWRFLSLSILSLSVLAGIVVFYQKRFIKFILAALIIFLTVFFNWQYFRPSMFNLDITEEKLLKGDLWEEQQKGSIYDYLPIGAGVPDTLAPSLPVLSDKTAKLSDYKKDSKSWSFNIDVKDGRVDIIVPVFDYPVWTVFANGVEIKHANKNKLGLIEFSLDKGSYSVKGLLKNTGLRSVSNLVSLLSILLLFATYALYYRKK